MLKKIALPVIAAIAATVSLASPARALVLTDFDVPAPEEETTRVLISRHWTSDTSGCPQGWSFKQQMTFVVIDDDGVARPETGMFCTDMIYPNGETYVSGVYSPADGEYIYSIGVCAC